MLSEKHYYMAVEQVSQQCLLNDQSHDAFSLDFFHPCADL
jgi:hypothetical protein